MKCDCAFCLQLIGHCHTHIFQIVCVCVGEGENNASAIPRLSMWHSVKYEKVVDASRKPGA